MNIKPTDKQIDEIVKEIGKGFNLAVLDKSWEHFPRTITMNIIDEWEKIRGQK